MPIAENVVHIYEPTCLQCGQTVLAMLTGSSVEQMVQLTGKKNEITLKDMFIAFNRLGINISHEKLQVTEKSQLPEIALLSLETRHCWHWSLYYNGRFLDPEYGELYDFPPSKRKFCFKISK